MQWASTKRNYLFREYDLVLATSMLDLASLRGLIPKLAKIPNVLYFHENQFAYPTGQQRSENIEPQTVPLHAALCADAIIFNSAFNRETCLEGARKLAKRLPEGLPAVIFTKLENANVLPIPLSTKEYIHQNQSALPADSPMEIGRNHRWEYDKGTDLLAAVVEQTKYECLRFRFNIVGQQFRDRPKEFNTIDRNINQIGAFFKMHRGAFGYIDDFHRYQALLKKCHVVLSTAKHDFQGLSVQEACLAGCQAAVPDHLVYPEYIPPQFRYQVSKDSRQTAAAAIRLLKNIRKKLDRGMRNGIDFGYYCSPELLNRYRGLFSSMISNRT